MSKKHDLREQRYGTIINATSKRQEKALDKSIKQVIERLYKEFPGIRLAHESQVFLHEVTALLKKSFPGLDFHFYHKTSSMRPDGGILYLLDKRSNRFPILIAEKKNQGTNDLRAEEGKQKQAKGNAIERLGKNVIGFRTALLNESIFPFICFGDGCDFSDDSSILDRVVTIAMFGKLNVEYLHNSGPNREFNRGSFFFRQAEWTGEEMLNICFPVAQKSVWYYFSKYGKDSF